MQCKHILLSVLITFSACSLAPKYEAPKMDLPDDWGTLQDSTEEYNGTEWWKCFKDPLLNAFVEEGVQKNKDLLLASVRIEEANANWGVEKSYMFPTLSTTIGASYNEQYNTAKSQFNRSKKMTSDQYRIAANLQYEIDFWGKFLNMSRIAKAQYLSSIANREIVRTTLISSIVTTYFNIVALQKQEKLLTEVLESVEQQLTIRQTEYQAGAITNATLKQMEAQVAAIKSQKNDITSSLINARAAMTILLGKSPREMLTIPVDLSQAVWNVNETYSVAAGSPANLLLRRPDIYQAEQQIRAANANIGVARAAFFPSISISAVIGALSGDITKIFKEPMMWGIGGESNAPLFAGGRVIYQNKAAKAQQKEAFAQYELTVQNAYKDVIVALSQMKQADINLNSAQLETAAYEETLRLTEAQFKAGQVDAFQYLSILQQYIASKERLLVAEQNKLVAVVNTYKSLGGDWEAPEKKKEKK